MSKRVTQLLQKCCLALITVAFEFTKTISYDFFHGAYWEEYSERTGIFVNRLNNPKHMHQEHYGDSKLTGGFTDHVVIPYENFDAELLNSAPNQVIRDSYDRCKPEEVLVGIPTAGEKTLCLQEATKPTPCDILRR